MVAVSSETGSSLQSVDRALHVLEMLASWGLGGVSELADEIGVHKSTALDERVSPLGEYATSSLSGVAELDANGVGTTASRVRTVQLDTESSTRTTRHNCVELRMRQLL